MEIFVLTRCDIFILLGALTLFGLGAKWPPLRVFAKYLKNGLTSLHETL